MAEDRLAGGGVGLEKVPTDMWIYQEIIHELRPDLIIETGTLHGGSGVLPRGRSADLVGHGRVVTIDIEHRDTAARNIRASAATSTAVG